MKIVNYLYATQLTICFASAGVSAIGGDQANQQQQNGAVPRSVVRAHDYILNGNVITNGEQYADEGLVWLSRQRGDSAATFVNGYDIVFAALYRAGVNQNMRDYLKAEWDASKINPQTGKREWGTAKDAFLKMGIPEEAAEVKSQAAQGIFLRLKADIRNNRDLVMLESLLFISGVVPFDEYAAKWVEFSGAGPDQGATIFKHFSEKLRTSTERYYMQFRDRFLAFLRVCKDNRDTQQASAQPHVGQKRPAATQPAVAAPAAQRPRTVTNSELAVSSVQALVNEHASFKQKVDLQEGIIRQLRDDLARQQAEVAQRNATIGQLTTHNQGLQTSLQASNVANQELSQRNASLETQLKQLQAENQRLKSGTRGYVTVKQEIKQEPGIKEEEPNAGIDRPPI